MTNLLAIVPMPERFRRQFKDEIAAAFPELTINVVEHPSKAGPYLEAAEILMAHHVPDEVLARGRNLKWVQSLGSGVDGFLSRPSLRRDILLTRMHDIQGTPASEAILAMMLALARQLPRLLRNQQRRVWDRESAQLIDGKTVCILGVGRIAEALAPKCKALGMNVVGVSSRRESAAGFDRIRPRDELVDAAADADHLVVLVPLSAETRHIVGASVLSAMKPTAMLINVARGGVVDEGALIEALRRGAIAGAGLDVFEREPLPDDHPFWDMANVIVTPHAAAMHDGYVDQMLPTLTTNLGGFLAGDTTRMIYRVDR